MIFLHKISHKSFEYSSFHDLHIFFFVDLLNSNGMQQNEFTRKKITIKIVSIMEIGWEGS